MKQNHQGMKHSFNCQCIAYGKIDSRKLERLRKNRQKRMCAWKDLLPFSSNEPTVKEKSTNKTPLFPPIYMVPMKTTDNPKPEAFAQTKDLSLPRDTGCGSLACRGAHSNIRCVEESQLPSGSRQTQQQLAVGTTDQQSSSSQVEKVAKRFIKNEKVQIQTSSFPVTDLK